MNKPETTLRNSIVKEVKARYGLDLYIKKIHGSPYQEAGIPDLIGCYKSVFFGMEIKVGVNGATLIQEANIRDIILSGGWARVIRSVEEAVEFIDWLGIYVIQNKALNS